MPKTRMDGIDKQILNIIQSAFPLASTPYAVIGERVGVSEEEAFERVERMRKDGIIRRIGANFQSGGLGHVSTLCAARVPREKMDSFIEVVNALQGVTHNYERAHEWNIWFTLIAPSREAAAEILRDITQKTGVEIMNLPATRMFKIRVDFPMEN